MTAEMCFHHLFCIQIIQDRFSEIAFFDLLMTLCWSQNGCLKALWQLHGLICVESTLKQPSNIALSGPTSLGMHLEDNNFGPIFNPHKT